MRINYRSTGDVIDSLAWEALRRNGGEPVTLDQVKTMFVELLEHEADCGCGKCDYVQAAQPRQVFRSAELWSHHQKRCGKVLG